MLRSELAEYLTSEPAPLSFFIEAPVSKRDLYVLVDRSGFVLGRTRTLDEILNIVGGHLAACLTQPRSTARFRLRALVDSDGRAVLVMPPLLMVPPVIERRLGQSGHRIVDRLVVDIDRECCVHVAAGPWSGLGSVAHGHATSIENRAVVSSLFWPHSDDTAPTAAQLVGVLASTCYASEQREACLEIAKRIIATGVVSVDLQQPSAVYERLRNSQRLSDSSP